MPMITAIELDDLVLFRESAGEAYRRHARLGAGVAHPDLFDARHCVANEFCHCHFVRVGYPEARSTLRRRLHRSDDCRMRMAENCRTPRADVVDVVVAIDIKNVRTLSPIDEEWLSAHGTECAHG